MESTGTTGAPPPEEASAPLEAAAPEPVNEPAAAAPAAQPAAAVPAAAPPPAASSTPGWVNTVTSTQTVAGPAGMTYADVPTRIFAYIIDAIILGIAFAILYAIFGALFIGSLIGGFQFMLFVWFVVLLLIYAAGSAIYFIYTWTKMRGSPGQRVLGLETLNAADGAVLTQPQAIRRWLFMFGPFVLAQAASLMLGGLGLIVSLALFAYAVYLLYSTANSPTRQGFHDVQASTVVVKVAR
jgi:uncharacterized RDD family membrane protein YckC